MLRPARLAALVAAVLTTAAVGAAPASAGTAAITISGCTLNASSSGTPPANVVVSPTTGRCTVNGINGTATSNGSTTLTTQPDGSVTADRIVLTINATIIFPISCTYTAANVNLGLVSAGPPAWTYHSDSVTATRTSGSSLCTSPTTGPADITITP